jgi:hypothetical protein
MPNFAFPFDASSIQPQDRSPLPAGPYLVQIIHSEFRPTKDGTGKYLLLELEVLEGPYTGRRLFDRINLVNPNPKAQQIAEQTLAAICRAVGKVQVISSEELHHIPLIAEVRLDPAKGGYDESNSIKRYSARGQDGTASPAAPAPRPAPSAPAAAAAPATAAAGVPWKRRA